MSTNVRIVTESSASLQTSSKGNEYRELTEYRRPISDQELNFTNHAVILSTNDADNAQLQVRLFECRTNRLIKVD